MFCILRVFLHLFLKATFQYIKKAKEVNQKWYGETEADSAESARCSKLSVLIVEKNAKFLSSQRQEDRSIARKTIQNTKSTDANILLKKEV